MAMGEASPNVVKPRHAALDRLSFVAHGAIFHATNTIPGTKEADREDSIAVTRVGAEKNWGGRVALRNSLSSLLNKRKKGGVWI
jgi:hypothetical protein